eukprot:2641119-Prymnesium_polylepis.2
MRRRFRLLVLSAERAPQTVRSLCCRGRSLAIESHDVARIMLRQTRRHGAPDARGPGGLLGCRAGWNLPLESRLHKRYAYGDPEVKTVPFRVGLRARSYSLPHHHNVFVQPVCAIMSPHTSDCPN